ncbi:MAG: hypothetical protein JXA79_03695 [Deltaproteobacteria bacterium]|nr:hypothetical protein [Deltaproteobacteria bacterium]
MNSNLLNTQLQDKILSAIAQKCNYPLFEIGQAYKRLKSFDRLLSWLNRATEQRRPLSDMVDVLDGNYGN